MANLHGSETQFELTTLQRLQLLGYDHQHGEDVPRPLEEVVRRDVLGASLARRYPYLPSTALDEAVARLTIAGVRGRRVGTQPGVARGTETRGD